MQQPYHKYIFDEKERVFVGKFEEMYANEDKEHFDSWFQDDLKHFAKQLSLLILNRYNFNSILDIGCGKGAFTSLLKTADNRVIGADLSRTAIRKAKTRFKGVQFKVVDGAAALRLDKQFDLIVMMEILSYLKNWRLLIKNAAKKAGYAYITLYLPPDPIGFVKSFAELKKEIKNYFKIETELLWDNEHIFILAKSRKTEKGG